jgi:hypothetical protein
MNASVLKHSGFELHFESLGDARRGCIFPCDARGQVDLDALGERQLDHYLYVRALIGREYRLPQVSRRTDD